ncbi:MAG: 30S ribosomal protein S17e [Nanobdellota archaeon]
MGRIKTMLIKRCSNDLLREHPSEFKKEFEQNKALVDKYTKVSSRKIRNIIAGYVTRLVKTRN